MAAAPRWFIRNIAEVPRRQFPDHFGRDITYLPPRIDHAISNTGLIDLLFRVVTSPVSDDLKDNI
jgi:hypothetical protein